MKYCHLVVGFLDRNANSLALASELRQILHTEPSENLGKEKVLKKLSVPGASELIWGNLTVVMETRLYKLGCFYSIIRGEH